MKDRTQEIQEGLGHEKPAIKLKVKTFAWDWDEALLKLIKRIFRKKER